jgi:hypothetical protein
MGEARFGRNAADREFPFPQHHLGAIDAALDYILMHRQSDRLAKRGFYVGYADTGDGGDFF